MSTHQVKPACGSVRRSFRRRWSFRGAAAASALVGCVVCVELGLRIAGFTPFEPDPQVIVRVEPGPFLVPDDLLGYANAPGAARITYTTGYTYTATCTPDGTRVTRASQPGAGRPELWILGCSFSFGWSLADHETYPWLIQERLPAYDVVNFGVAGHGTVHSLLRLREGFERGQRPALVVLTYGSLHDERNVFSRAFRKAIVPFEEQTLGLRMPVVRLVNGELRVDYAPLSYEAPPLVRELALVEALDTRFNAWQVRRKQPQQVARRLLERIVGLCRRHDVPLVVAGIWSDEATHEALSTLAADGVSTVDISVDLSDPAMNLLPMDWHPSAAANREFARRLLAHLEGQRLVEAR
jgi:hypothetical protein